MKASDKGQVSRDAAEVYEQFFVPALFREWAPRLAEAAGIKPGYAALDVACGTGVLARELAGRVGSTGSVVGLDVNPAMLAVAERAAPQVQWIQAPAEKQPFAAAQFDAVLCQFGLMFFEDRTQALREMLRVTRPGHRLAVAVWDTLERSPGYDQLAALLERLFGSDVAQGLHAPFCLGDTARLGDLFASAGIENASITTVPGRARFPTLHAWIHTDVRGWTLSDAIDDAGFDSLCRAAEKSLADFVLPDGSVTFEIRAHVVCATKA